MKDSHFEPLGLLSIDTDIHYDLDMSKFPGLDDPEELKHLALMVKTQQSCEQWFDAITNIEYEDDEDTEDEEDVEEDHDLEIDYGCCFCDVLNTYEENENCTQLSEPCYIETDDDSTERLYFFNDSHECETVEIMDDESDATHYLICAEEIELEEVQEIPEISEEKTYWLNTSNSDGSICVQEHQQTPGSDNLNVVAVSHDISFTELTCQYLFEESESMDTSLSSTDSSHPYMDVCITDQLPLFIDLVDQLSPVLSPSGNVRSRKGDNSVDYSSEESFTHFLASDNDLYTIDTSMTGVNHVISGTICPRGS